MAPWKRCPQTETLRSGKLNGEEKQGCPQAREAVGTEAWMWEHGMRVRVGRGPMGQG